MDKLITVTRSFLNEIRAFCNLFVSFCDGCYRSSCDCYLHNEIQRAKMLIVMLDNVRDAKEEQFFIENPIEECLAKVEIAIRQGNGKPVASSQIKIPGESRQRKARALKLLVARHRILRIETEKEPLYVIANDDANQTTTQQ